MIASLPLLGVTLPLWEKLRRVFIPKGLIICLAIRGALQWRPCSPSPVAALSMPPTNAGISISLTYAWARSLSAPACRPAKILGPGLAASIPVATRGTHRRHRGKLRPSTRRLRGCMASVSIKPHRGRFSGMAGSARLDGREISALRSRRANAAGLETASQHGDVRRAPQSDGINPR